MATLGLQHRTKRVTGRIPKRGGPAMPNRDVGSSQTADSTDDTPAYGGSRARRNLKSRDGVARLGYGARHVMVMARCRAGWQRSPLADVIRPGVWPASLPHEP